MFIIDTSQRNEKLFSQVQSITLVFSIVLFLLSLTQTAFCNGDENCSESISVFLIGWLGVIVGGANLSYLSNISIFLAWFTLKKEVYVSFFFSIVAFLLALLPWYIGKVSIDEAGTPRTITSLELGYWLWLLSMVVTFCGLLFLVRIKNEKNL